MYQWTDGEVSHVVRLALESVRSAVPCLAPSHRSKLVDTLAGELSASAWHAHWIEQEEVEEDWSASWQTIVSDEDHDWTEFCPAEFYGEHLRPMLRAMQQSGSTLDQVAHRTCKLPAKGEHHALAWLAVQPEGACACVEFLRGTDAGPFTSRDEALVRILSTELLAEPTNPASRGEWPELAEPAELPRRQREVLAGLLAGSSVKEIASQLGISPYTVNDYIKALYRRYQVSSRGELMAAVHGLRRPAVPK